MSTIEARTGATSSSVSVPSREPKASRNASDRFPSPIVSGFRYSSKTSSSRKQLAGRLADRSKDVGGRDLLVDDEGEILAHLRVRAHLLEGDDLRRRLGERVEVELERSPDAVEQRRMELAEPALRRARGLPRVKCGWLVRS